MKDADLLFEWRNDPETRKASITINKIKKEHHISWLANILKDHHTKLYIAEKEGIPVGTVRSEYDESIYELSWTVAPGAREKGIGKKMVALLADRIPQPIMAKIKAGNHASIRIAEYTGMHFAGQKDNILHYKRDALKKA